MGFHSSSEDNVMRAMLKGLLGLILLAFASPADSEVVVKVFEGTGQIDHDFRESFTFLPGPQPFTGTLSFDDSAPGTCCWSYPAISFQITVGGVDGQVFTSIGSNIGSNLSASSYTVSGYPQQGQGLAQAGMRIIVFGPTQVAGLFPDFDLTNPEVTSTFVEIMLSEGYISVSSEFVGELTFLGDQPVSGAGSTWGRIKQLYD
jgi:hypothetical protein